MALKRSYLTVSAGIITSFALLAWSFWPVDSHVGGCMGDPPTSPPDGFVIRVAKPLPAGTVLRDADIMLHPIRLDSHLLDDEGRQSALIHMVSKRESSIARGYVLPNDVRAYQLLSRDELNLKPLELD